MRKFLLYSLLFSLLVSCTSIPGTPASKMPNIDIPIEEMNKTLKVTPAPGMAETFQQTGLLQLELVNLSNYAIIFPPDFNIKLFLKSGDEWKTTSNLFQYADGNTEIRPKGEYPSDALVNLMPSLDSNQTSTMLRVVVLGKVEATNKVVGAYIDIPLP